MFVIPFPIFICSFNNFNHTSDLNNTFNCYFINHSSNRQKGTKLILTIDEHKDFINKSYETECLGQTYADNTSFVRDIIESKFPPKKKTKPKLTSLPYQQAFMLQN